MDSTKGNDIMKVYHMTLLLLPMLLFVVGCGDSVEDSEADILDPTNVDPRFQDLPIAGGSLIPLDEIPVVTIEETRKDDEFYYWQLKADPAPIHEDLVIKIDVGRPNADKSHLVKLQNVKVRGSVHWEVGLALKDREVTYWLNYMDDRSLSEHVLEHLNNEGYLSKECYAFSCGAILVVVIPKLQNTSQEFKLPLSYIIGKKNETYGNTIHSSEVPELPPLLDDEGNPVSEYLRIEGEIVEDIPLEITYNLNVETFSATAKSITDNSLLDFSGNFRSSYSGHGIFTHPTYTTMDMPIFQTFEGYIIREGFALHLYVRRVFFVGIRYTSRSRVSNQNSNLARNTPMQLSV